MGKSSASCFNIITCGGGDGGVREDDLLSDSVKVSGDKRRWSFRKKSSTCRILSNSLAVDTTPSLLNKTINSETSDFHDQTVYSVEDKISVSVDGKSSPPTSKELKTLQIGNVGAEESKVDENIENYFAVALESSIHVLLAQYKMENLKSLVKFQAVVRGHLVRRQAIETLRCVRAIVKIQALVRNRQLCALLEKSNTGGKQTDIHDEDSFSSVAIIPSVYDPTKRSTSLERLLANRFARQLMKAERRRKPLVFRCDPLNPGSAAWLWLQRWMSVSSSSHQYRAAEYNDKSQVPNPVSPIPHIDPLLTTQEPDSILGPIPHHPFTFLNNPASTTKMSTNLANPKLLQPILDSPEKKVGEREEKEAERGVEACGTPERLVGMMCVEKSGSETVGKGKRVRGEGEEQESRESTSSSSVPSYMMSTESARARMAQVSGSPKSSPDVGGGGDLLLRKRHSLPGTGRSPRSWRSLSNIPQHKGKTNISSSARHPHERSWQR